MELRRVIMSLSIRLSLSRPRIVGQEFCAERGKTMPQTLEELRKTLGFDKPSARVQSARAPRRPRPNDDRHPQQSGELAAAARRTREALLTSSGPRSRNGTRH
jgi:hypothetical protein